MDTNIEQLEILLKEGKLNEARELVRALVRAPLSEEERGAGLVGAASVYLDIMNRIDAEYLESLRAATADLKEVSASETESTDSLKLEQVRENLSKNG